MDFGSLIEGSDADGLVQAVRQSRLARQAASTQDAPMTQTPTFGEVAEGRRAEQQMMAEQQAAQPQQASPEDILGQIGFMVDVTKGTFKPILPGEQAQAPGPKEIVLKMQPDGQPQVVATGKRVSDMDLAKLQDPKRGIQPKLDPSYQVPQEYAGLAEALGLAPEGGAEEVAPQEEPEA